MMKKNNSYFHRSIDAKLIAWKNDEYKKPLLVRGARQVGKSSAIRKLGETFDYFLEVNFEIDKGVYPFFDLTLDPISICSKLSVYYNVPIVPGRTLLFFDEIQSCIPAISSLRFFYEKYPELHVVAAGSLLEFALSEIPSFGVGRIRSMFMHPFSFDEFLEANGEANLVEIKQQSNWKSPILEPFHNKLIDYLKIFLIIGGLPEVILTYVKTKDFLACNKVLNDLILTYTDDFAKYKNRVNKTHLLAVFNAVAKNSGQKFVYSQVSDQMFVSQVKDSLELLTMSGIIIPVEHTSANGIPLGAEVKLGKSKYVMFDTGICLKILNLNIGEFIASTDFSVINKGHIAEVFAGLELLKYSDCLNRNSLYYWKREEKSGNAEVDYILQLHQAILPIEIKSGTKGSMQSLHYFMEKKNISKGMRCSLENFAQYETIDVLPLYALSNLFLG
jgi:predicted AAA+ superfamily ATPase